MPEKYKEALDFLISQGIDLDKEEAFAELWEINERSKNGTVALTTFFEQRKITDKPLRKRAIEVYYEESLQTFPLNLLDGAAEVLASLSDHTLAIVTQGDHEGQMDKFRRANLDTNLFAKIIVTPNYDKGKNYANLQTEFGADPATVLVVGDKYKTDLLPAKELGMKTVHMKWGRGRIMVPSSGEVDYIIENLKELREIVKKLQ